MKQLILRSLIVTLSVFGISCSFMAKNNSSREVASISPSGPMQNDQGPAKTQKDILQGLKTGQIVVSHVVYLENKKPVCHMPADSRLVPDFAKPQGGYSRGFSSKVIFKKGFPKCGSKQYNFVASAKNNFVPEGTQVAAFPLVAAGASVVGGVAAAAAGCIIGAIERLALDENRPFIQGTLSALGGFISGGLPGAGVAIGGYALCGPATAYVLEDSGPTRRGAPLSGGCFKEGMWRVPCPN